MDRYRRPTGTYAAVSASLRRQTAEYPAVVVPEDGGRDEAPVSFEEPLAEALEIAGGAQ